MSKIKFIVKKAGEIVFERDNEENIDENFIKKLTKEFSKQMDAFYSKYEIDDEISIEVKILNKD